MLPDKYNYKENDYQKKQEEAYKWDEKETGENSFIIDTPPPTISGYLHMGHVFSYCQADFIARYKRMKGMNVFYPIGFDDNGLPTERLVEKVKNIKAKEVGREEFIKLCKEVVVKAEEECRALFKSISLSFDWAQEYQTISEQSRKISQMSFIDLHNKGEVYRQIEPTLWDPVDQTALAQADIVDKEIESHMNFINFSCAEDSSIALQIMTTRPELLNACVAVLHNPNDSRYNNLKGKHAIVPLFGLTVPIIADSDVLQDKGTGLVMCCTFGDEQDITWWKRHKLETRIILEKNGRFNSETSVCSGMTVKQAREEVLKILIEKECLIRQEKITHMVKCAERSGAPLEILVNPQWFIKILDKKDILLERAKECNFHPSYMKVRLQQWIEGLSWDWCISRQRYFGIPIPVWYSKRNGEEGKVLLPSTNQLPINPLVDLPEGYSREEIIAEEDVLDTWATSSVSPQLSSLGISNDYAINKDKHNKLFPADLRPQAHEIIRTWAFYTIVKAQIHSNCLPWKDVMISGWCLAHDKTKMSKSKGNAVTPVSLIEEKGSDVVRYWASTSHLGVDTAFSEELFKIGQKLITKLWNAAKFSSLNFSYLTQKPSTPLQDIENDIICHTVDKWILSKLKIVITKASEELEKFEYAKARGFIEDFFWNDFCDNYLEIVKVRSYGVGAEVYKDKILNDKEITQINKWQQSVATTIYHILFDLLKLFAPFIPNITEEIYQKLFSAKGNNTLPSIHSRGSWPKENDHYYDDHSCKIGDELVLILGDVRKYKSENNLSMKHPIAKLTISKNNHFKEDIISDLKFVTSSASIEYTDFENNEKTACV